MRIVSPRRAVVAVATALACLGMLASPASATNNSATIAAATFTINTTPPQTFTIPSTPHEPQCDPALPSGAGIVLDVTGSAPNRTSTVVAIDPSPFKSQFAFNGAEYQLDLYLADPISTGLSNSGTLTGNASPYVFDQDIAFEGFIYAVDPPDCEKDDEKCHFFLQLNVDGQLVTPSAIPGSNVIPNGSSVSNAAGSGTAFTLECDPIFASLDQATVTVSDLDLTFP